MAPPQAKPTKKTDNLWQKRARYPPAIPRPIDKSKSTMIWGPGWGLLIKAKPPIIPKTVRNTVQKPLIKMIALKNLRPNSKNNMPTPKRASPRPSEIL